MRSESDGHCLPTSFPGLAVREALRRRSVAPLLASVCDRYHPTVGEFLAHVEELRRGSGWDARVVPSCIAQLRAVDGGFELGDHGVFRHVLLATGHAGLAVPDELRDDPRAVHAYEPHDYAESVCVVGAGLACHARTSRGAASHRSTDCGELSEPRSSASCSDPRIRRAASGTSRSSRAASRSSGASTAPTK